jgi:hypothetical protein
MERDAVRQWVVRGAVGLVAAAPLAWLVYHRPEGGYGHWGEAGLYVLAAVMAAGALVLSELVLAYVRGSRLVEGPARPVRGTRVAAAEDLLRKETTPVPGGADSLLARQLQFARIYAPGVLEAAGVHPTREVLDDLEEALRRMEGALSDQLAAAVGTPKAVALCRLFRQSGTDETLPAVTPVEGWGRERWLLGNLWVPGEVGLDWVPDEPYAQVSVTYAARKRTLPRPSATQDAPYIRKHLPMAVQPGI